MASSHFRRVGNADNPMRRLFIIALFVLLLIGGSIAYFRCQERLRAEAAATRSSEEFRDANKKLDDTLKLPRGM
jgi:hypothetical protein